MYKIDAESSMAHAALGELAGWDQWVCYRYADRNTGKESKVPVDHRTGRNASVRDPATWTSHDNALAVMGEHGYDGVGFVFTRDDPYCGVDLDGCLDPDTGEIRGWATAMVDALDSYTEVSPSGTGLHIIVRATLPGGGIKTPRVEMYDSGRYFTFTGNTLPGTREGIETRQEAIEALYEEYGQSFAQAQHPWTTPAPEGVGEIVEKARNAKNGDRFRALYDHGDTSGYASQSEADFVLMLMLAFWFAADPESMEAAFNESALGQREKWTRPDYRTNTIQRALREHNGKTYAPKNPPTPEVLERIERMRAWAIRHEWKGRNKARNRHAYNALLDTGSVQGVEHPEGIAVGVGVHYLALKAGISDPNGLLAAISDLEGSGPIRVLKRGTDERTVNTYFIRCQTHNSIDPCVLAVMDMAPLLQRVRENGSGFAGGEVVVKSRDHNRTVAHVIQAGPREPIVSGSIGKRAAYLIEKVILEGGRMSKKRATLLMGAGKPARLMERIAGPAIEAGLLVYDEDAGELIAPTDLRERLEKHLEDTGILEAERRQLHYIRTRADKAPTDTDLEANRERMQAVVRLREREAIERADEEERRKVGMTARVFILEAIDGIREGFHWPTLREEWKGKGGKARRLSAAANALKAEGRLRWWKAPHGNDWHIARTEEAA